MHYNLYVSLLGQGIPLHGFGIQGHLIVGESPSASSVSTNIARFTALGVEVAITGEYPLLSLYDYIAYSSAL